MKTKTEYKKRLKKFVLHIIREDMENEPYQFHVITKQGTYVIVYEKNKLQSVNLVKNPFIE